MTLDSDIDLFLVRARAPELDGHDVSPDLWEQQLTELARLVTASTAGNDARVVGPARHDLAAASADEPLLRDVAKQGLTVAGTRAWSSTQLRPIVNFSGSEEILMAGQRDCDAAVTAGRISKADQTTLPPLIIWERRCPTPPAIYMCSGAFRLSTWG